MSPSHSLFLCPSITSELLPLLGYPQTPMAITPQPINFSLHQHTVSSQRKTKSPQRQRKPPKQTEKEKEEELRRKIERNRAVFEAWLERKKEEQRVKLTLALISLLSVQLGRFSGTIVVCVELLLHQTIDGYCVAVDLR